MSLRRYRMGCATQTATVAAVDTFTTQRPGTLKQIQFNVGFNSITDNAELRCQISRSAVDDTGATGGAVTQALGGFWQAGNFVTSGLSQPNGNLIIDCNDKITIGESFYLNLTIIGTVSVSMDVVLVIEEAGA